MQRVMIVGGPGSGKSTLARQIGELTGLPVYHMDKIHYSSGWQERPSAEKSRMTHQVHVRSQWILEGGHSATYPERLARADTLIWLDYPFHVRVYRVLMRSFKYRGQTRPDLPPGCPEQFNAGTINFLRFIFRTRNTARRKIELLFDNLPSHVKAYKLTNNDAIKAFVGLLDDIPADTISKNKVGRAPHTRSLHGELV